MSVSVHHGGGVTPRHHQSSTSSSLLACVREASPLPDPDDDNAETYSGVGVPAEPSNKKRRFHPLRGLRRMFRRKPRVETTNVAPEPVLAVEEVCGEPTGNSLLLPNDPNVHLRSLSASELLGASPDLQTKRRSGGALSGGSGGGSVGALGSGLSVSHDSVFTSEARAGSSSPRGGGSALDLPEYEGVSPLPGGSSLALQPQPIASHAGVRAELFEAVRRRRGRGRGRGGDASEDDDEDLGLPSSPYGGSPTTADVLMERANKEAPTKSHSTCSDGSLLSMGSSEMDEDSQMSGHSSKISLHDRSPLDSSHSTVKDPDLEMLGESVGAPLSHNAARHKIAVRPKRNHGAPRNRRLQQVVSATLPVTPEALEEFPRSYSPDNRGKRALPPAMPAATSPVEPIVKLSRSQSSSDPPASPPGRHGYRRAVSAARLEQAAIANAAVSRSRAMFGSESKEDKVANNQSQGKPEQTSPLKEEKCIVNRPPIKKQDEGKVEPISPIKDEKSMFSKSPVKLEPLSPLKDENTVQFKPPQSKKVENTKPEPLSIMTFPEDSPTQEVAPIPGPKPENRKVSSASLRQRVEPGLVSPDEFDSPIPWTPPANKVSVSHFIRLAEPRQTELHTDMEVESVTLRQKESSAPTEHRLSVKSKVSDFQSLMQDSPSSLDSLETETQAQRRLRSLSQSPVDSLERIELKMSSDSLSSGADMSSTSDDPRPYLKHRRPRRPTPDTSDPDEAKPVVPRPVKLRSVSRHSDPPFTGKNAVEIASVIRKSASVESMRSLNEIKNTLSNEPQTINLKSASTDSISSFDNTESSENSNKNINNKIQEQNKEVNIESQYGRVKRTSINKYLSEDTKNVEITLQEPLRLSIVSDHSKQVENDVAKSPKSPKWDAKPRLSLSTPSVPEFLRVQLNHIDNTPTSNIILSTSPAESAEPINNRRSMPVEKTTEKEEVKESGNEMSSVRDRLFRKSLIDEPKVVEVSEKIYKEESSESVINILNRRPSQVKRQELSLKATEVEVKTKPEVQPTEKVTHRISAVFLKDTEIKTKSEPIINERNTNTQRFSMQTKVAPVPVPNPKPTNIEVKSIRKNSNDSNNVTIIPRSNVIEAKIQEQRNVVVNTQKPVPCEKPPQLTKMSVAPKIADKSVEVQEVVLRRKSIAPETKRDDEPELFKVFARRSLKLNKDTDVWEGQATTQKSRDSDKENDDNTVEKREKKSSETKTLNSSIVNNNVTSSVINSNVNNNINNNSNVRRAPRTQSMGPVSLNNNNNNQEAINAEVRMRTPSPEKPTRPRPMSVADLWGGRNIELVGGDTPAPASPIPATVTAEKTGDKSLTPKVRRRMQEWERWANRKEALP